MGGISTLQGYSIEIERRRKSYYITIRRKNKKIVYSEAELPNSGKARLYRLLIQKAREKNIAYAKVVAKTRLMHDLLLFMLSQNGIWRKEYDVILPIIEKNIDELELVEKDVELVRT